MAHQNRMQTARVFASWDAETNWSNSCVFLLANEKLKNTKATFSRKIER